jgi:hypothetical protein
VPLTLYEINDNKKKLLWQEEITWMAVWAGSPEEAIRFYCSRHEYRNEINDLLGQVVCREARVDGQPLPPGIVPAQEGLHEEARPGMLRALGWAMDDELRCDACDMAAMGDPQYQVCSWCQLCPDCKDSDCELCGKP